MRDEAPRRGEESTTDAVGHRAGTATHPFERRTRRRGDDGVLVLLANSIPVVEHATGPASAVAGADWPMPPSMQQLARTTFLVDLPGDEVLALPGAGGRLMVRGEGAGELPERTAAAAGAWRSERERSERRTRTSDWLMVYVDHLNAAGSDDDVYRALAGCAAKVGDAFDAVVYAPAGDGGAMVLRPHPIAGNTAGLPTLAAATLASLPSLIVLTDVEARPGSGSPYSAMAPAFEASGAAQLLCVPVTPAALLVVVERRRDRVFTAEDRDVLQWLVRQTERSRALRA